VELIDSSAWVEYLRGTGSVAHHEVRRLVHERPTEIATTEPIIMELLAGPTDPRTVERLEQLTAGLPLLGLQAAIDYHEAAAIYRVVRRRGETVRKLLDCLIAAVSLRTGATLVHCDRDFDRINSCIPDLRARSLP
jgi:predicted nucleic acid-binding protein